MTVSGLTQPLGAHLTSEYMRLRGQVIRDVLQKAEGRVLPEESKSVAPYFEVEYLTREEAHSIV